LLRVVVRSWSVHTLTRIRDNWKVYGLFFVFFVTVFCYIRQCWWSDYRVVNSFLNFPHFAFVVMVILSGIHTIRLWFVFMHILFCSSYIYCVIFMWQVYIFCYTEDQYLSFVLVAYYTVFIRIVHGKVIRYSYFDVCIFFYS